MKRFLVMLVTLVSMFTLIASANASTKYIVNTQSDPLNVRDAAGGGAVVGTIKKGSVIEVLSFKNGWAKIGDNRYVWAEYLAPYSGNKNPSSVKTQAPREKASVDGTTVMYVSRDMKGFLNIRAQESVKSEHLGKLYPGDKVYVAENRGEWLKIVYEGRYAYVLAKYIDKKATEKMPLSTGTYRVVGGRLNVRKSPNKEAEMLDQLKEGDTVRMIEDLGGWCKVYYRGNRMGYVMRRFIVAQ